MAANVAPPKTTGGGGFVFEDDVCAWMLACMLSGEPVFDADLGAPIRLDFQTRPDGWFLDDVLITATIGSAQHRFATSIKSNAQFTASAAPSDFVSSVWEQWLHIGSSVFDPERDFMTLITAPLSGAASASVSGLAEKSRVADPSLLPARLATSDWATEDERKLFASFACPAALNGAGQTDVDTARLLQRLRFLQRDFGASTSESLKGALELCRRAVRNHSNEDAHVLWNILRGVAAEHRPRAGSVALRGLIDRVRGQVRLADYPDHAGDWSTLDARSQRDATLVPDSIGGRVKIERAGNLAHLIAAVGANQLVALLGASGAGKSALGRALFERRRASSERTLWIDAGSLDCADFGTFESALRLRYPLADLLSTATLENPLLILDGLDKLYSGPAFRNAATLLHLARQQPASIRWRVVAPCQSLEWPRVLEELQRAGAVGGQWTPLQLEALKPSDLEPVSKAVPSLARLLLQPRVASLLTNLKLLDLVVRRVDAGGTFDSTGLVGESSVADWFWTAEIDRGADKIARGRFVRVLAQRQADELITSLPVDSFDGGDLGPLASLSADQLCVQVPGDRIAFAHDLYGDWARLRILLNNRSALPEFLQNRHESPLWHRALRLFGIHLLEHSGGVADWRAALLSFRQGEMGVVHDVLLEAPVFAVNSQELLEKVLPDLLANDGVLLRRLLKRFLAFATVPDAEKMAIARSVGMDASAARAAYRVPFWPYWIDVLAFLHGHRDHVLPAAPDELARVVEMWLSFAPTGAIRRTEAAELGVTLGRHALSMRNVRGRRESKRERERLYNCALRAADERPEDVAAIALTAAERVARPASGEASATPQRRPRGFFDGPGTIRGPWPDGPLAAVDEAFQAVVLDGPAIRELYRVRPAVAREVILATLIEEPREERWNDNWMRRKELEVVNRHNWMPAFYVHGPFLVCLRDNFTEGSELIARLVEFAAQRAEEHASRELDEWRAQARTEGRPEAEIDALMASAGRRQISLFDGNSTLSFSGDERLYGWSAGLGNPPDAVESALMALEQYFYQRLDNNEDVAGEVGAVLARARSVAFLGVLCDVGKRQRVLFEGPLRPLLSSPEIYAWEITKIIQSRTHLMIGAFDRGEFFVKLAQKFHGLEHRKSDLRNIAIWLMLRSAAMQEYFACVRAWWLEQATYDGREAELVQQLVISLDPKNYEAREDPQHGVVLVNVEAERVHGARAAEHQAMNDQMLVTAFPMRCRTILDEEQKKNDEQLEEFWGSWSRIRELAKAGRKLPTGEERFGDEYANAIAGGAAVLLWHDDWISKDSSRRGELEAALLDILKDPPESSGLDNDDSVSTWTWDCFAADAVAMLWTRDQKNEGWRRLVGEAVFSQKYSAVRVLFNRCAWQRGSLGEDFARLRRLALEWAYVRNRFEVARRSPAEGLQLKKRALERVRQNLVDWREEKLSAFVNGLSSGMPADWSECDEPNRFRALDGARRKWPGFQKINLRVVRCSHEWLPLPDDALDAVEREDVIRFLRSALTVVVARPLSNLNQRHDQYPHDEERWVLEIAGAAVLQLNSDEKPELFWQRIVDLHSEAHDWPEVFLRSLHRRALRAETTPASYIQLQPQIVQQALTDIGGTRRWSRHERVWETLIGIDWYSADHWEERHVSIVKDLSDVFVLWMEKVPVDGRRIGNFATWLGRPAASPIRFTALQWILERVRMDGKRAPRDVDEAEDAIAKLLNIVWSEQQDQLRKAPKPFAAFRGLLTWLGERQNQIGLELLGRIGSLG